MPFRRTKIEAGRVQVQNAPFDFGSLTRDVLDLMRERATEKGLSLLLDQAPEVPRFVRSDETRLRQVLVNLLANAIKFTSQGGVVLRLRAVRETEAVRLSIAVEDTGPGIAADDQARIFEPFVQVGQPTAQHGTGLGLAITRQFVELMGGRIELGSELGSGSCFRVELPVGPASETDVPAVCRDLGEVTGLAPDEPAWRALIVEDQIENARLLEGLLRSVGFQTRVAVDGAHGIDVFREWQPHFIWMDVRMPRMDGIEATRRIRTLAGGREVKIVALTASAFAEQRGEILAAGMDDVLYKPYRANDLWILMERHLGVRFKRGDNQVTESDSTSLLVAGLREMVQTLPESWLAHLHDEAIRCDLAAVVRLIEEIRPTYPAVATALATLAASFDYDSIAKYVDRTEGAPASAEAK